MEYRLNIRVLELNLGVRHNIFIIIKIQHLQHFHGAFFKRILFLRYIMTLHFFGSLNPRFLKLYFSFILKKMLCLIYKVYFCHLQNIHTLR